MKKDYDHHGLPAHNSLTKTSSKLIKIEYSIYFLPFGAFRLGATSGRAEQSADADARDLEGPGRL